MSAWAEMLPYTVYPYLNDDAKQHEELTAFVKKYDRPNTSGCLFSGAGGGFLMIVNEKDVSGATRIKINHDTIVKPQI